MQNTDMFILMMAIVAVGIAIISPRLQFERLKLWHVMVIALLTRMPLMVESAWYDETFTGVISQFFNHPQYRDLVLSDVHPPLAYAFFPLHQTGILGDALLRLVPLLAGLWVVYLVYAVCKEMYKKSYRVDEIAIIASLLVAVMPAFIQYSAEARVYMIMVALVLVGVLAILKNKPYWFSMMLILPLINNHGYVWLGVLYLITLPKMRKNPKWIEWALAWFFIVTFSILAFIYFTYPQMADVSNGFWLRNITLGSFLSSFASVTVGARMPSGVMVLVGIYVFVFIVVSIRAQSRNYILWALVFLAPVITAIVSVFWHSIYLPRAMLPAGTFLVIGFAYFASQSSLNRVLTAMLVAMPFVFNYSPDYQKMDIRTFITEGCEGTDVIYAPATNLAIMAKWYSNDIPVVLGENPNDLSQWLSDEALDILDLPRVDWDDLRGKLVCVPFLVSPTMGWSQREFLSKINLMTTTGFVAKKLMETRPYIEFYIYRAWRYE